VKLAVDLASELTGHSGHCFELFAAGREQAVRGPEVAEERALPRRADAADAIEFAQSSPEPDPATVTRNVYSD